MVTGPLAKEFAQVREAHKMVQVAIGFSDSFQTMRWNAEFVAALARIEEHTHNMGASFEPVLDAFEDHLEDTPCDGCEDLVIRARAALSAGEGTPA